MNDDDWYGESDSWDFDPLEMERYDWLNNHYSHGLLKPNHHLSIERNGFRGITVWMRWMAKAPHDLIQEIAIDTSENTLSYHAIKVRFDGQDATSVASLPKSAQSEIAKVEETYGLDRRLTRLEPQLREHCARSSLEYWRRLETTCSRAEAEFNDQNRQVIAAWQSLKQSRAKGYSPPENAYEESAAQKKIAYMKTKATAEQLCLTADQARHDADTAKVDAMNEVASFRARYPDVALPIDRFVVTSAHNRGGRMRM